MILVIQNEPNLNYCMTFFAEYSCHWQLYPVKYLLTGTRIIRSNLTLALWLQRRGAVAI